MNVTHNKIFVDDLAAVTTERELMDLFSRYGNVVEVNFAADRVNHKPRGFGFVTMATSEGARSAIQALNCKAVVIYTLAVSSKPFQQRGRGSVFDQRLKYEKSA